MKNFLQTITMAAGFIWLMFTDEEARRQLDYDNGGGEIE